MQRIYAVGETILDIIFRDKQPQVARPGGSSFNASISLGRLGTPVTLISEMGNDRVGDLIQEFMEENGVETKYLSRYKDGQSAIALAFLNDQSDAEYQFFKDYPRQRLDVDFPPFEQDDLLIFGSFYALNPGIRERVRVLLESAKEMGVTIIYDPNFRETHAPARDDLIHVIRENMEFSSVVRASDEDMKHIFSVDNPDDAWKEVNRHCDALVYTANSRGVFLRTNYTEMDVGVEEIEPVSTIGAGDTFNAGLLYGIWLNGYTKAQIPSLGRMAWEQLIKGAIEFSREVCLSYDNYLPVEYAEKIKASRKP